MLALACHHLPLSAGRAYAAALLLAQAESPEAAELGWVIAVLGFGGLLVGCVWLLLRREGEPDAAWLDTQGHGPHIQHVSRLLRAIRAVNSLVVTERDPDQLLTKACELLTTTRGYRMAWMGLIDDGGATVRPVASAGHEKGFLAAIHNIRATSEGLAGPTDRAVATGEPVVLRSLDTDPGFQPWREEALKRGYHALAAMPLRFRGQALGSLSVYAETADAFGIEEVGLLQEVADHIAHALGSIRLEADLREALARGERFMHIGAVFDGARAGIVVTDSAGVISDVNRTMLSFLKGFDRAEDLIGRIGIGALALFGSEEARKCIEAVLEAGACAAFTGSAHSGHGADVKLSCRGIPVLADPEGSVRGGVVGSVWFVQPCPGRDE